MLDKFRRAPLAAKLAVAAVVLGLIVVLAFHG